MPKVLIVAATFYEVEPLLKQYQINAVGKGLFNSANVKDLSVLITGVGMVNTAYQMGKCLQKEYDYCINLGIAGAFNRNLQIGEVVNVIQDTISEMGAEDGGAFIKYTDLNLGGTNIYSAKNTFNSALINQFTKVNSITVNKVHGEEAGIQKTKELFNPDIESMEGAAFLRACSQTSGICLQLRAISNYVERRNKSNWNIPLAIKNLNEFAIAFLQEIDS